MKPNRGSGQHNSRSENPTNRPSQAQGDPRMSAQDAVQEQRSREELQGRAVNLTDPPGARLSALPFSRVSTMTSGNDTPRGANRHEEQPATAEETETGSAPSPRDLLAPRSSRRNSNSDLRPDHHGAATERSERRRLALWFCTGRRESCCPATTESTTLLITKGTEHDHDEGH